MQCCWKLMLWGVDLFLCFQLFSFTKIGYVCDVWFCFPSFCVYVFKRAWSSAVIIFFHEIIQALLLFRFIRVLVLILTAGLVFDELNFWAFIYGFWRFEPALVCELYIFEEMWFDAYLLALFAIIIKLYFCRLLWFTRKRCWNIPARPNQFLKFNRWKCSFPDSRWKKIMIFKGKPRNIKLLF